MRAAQVAWLAAWARPALSEPAAEPSPPAAPAHVATDAAAENSRQEAKQRFLRGLELAKAGSWDAALAEFLASRELFPTRTALKNVAISQRHLKRYAEAVATYQELIARFADQLTPTERLQLDEALAGLRPLVAELDVTSSPSGARIVVDGQPRGTTPLPAPLLVNAGSHSLRLSKAGFEPFETPLTIAGKQRKSVTASLRPLATLGRLVVSEANGRVLDVLLDGAVVGKTPWQGLVGVGVHSVALRGADNLGTQPVTATVRTSQIATVSLRSTQLDAELRVEPTPVNARVDLDGVHLGLGVWQGRLTSGQHQLEVYALGHVPYRRPVVVRPAERGLVRVSLERDLSNPLWKVGFRQNLYFEAALGGALASSLGSSADQACAADRCSDRARPLGLFAGLRTGYRLTSGLGLELLFAYARLSQRLTRQQTADINDTTVSSTDYEDTTLFSAPLAALSASFQLFEATPLVFRLAGGVARARVTTTNQGTFSETRNGETPSLRSSIPEQGQSLWVPLLAPEVRFGYRLAKRWQVDVGLAAFLFFGPPSPRTDRITDSPSTGERWDALSSGYLVLPAEDAIGTFLALVPTVGGRFDL